MDNSGVVLLKSAEKCKVVQKKLCFPSCIKSHWFLLVVNHPEKTIDYICSKGTPHIYKQYALCVKELLEVACGKEWSKYLVRIPLKIPKQTDATSCGIFVMKFMELWDGKKLSKKLKKKPELMRSEFLLKLLDNSLNERQTELYRMALA
ncbi:uncharacterized protein LOC132284842 isoform X3 [Cornus florida]|uniref:uncharacterized protein LOC132284842 isoform X3 n=1 Tax=Cornus florida TaxID=4283 RepID=UPI0028A05E56|nr:uncharacterized protein LOC132284842 isoform X3 [Cornus florida]